MKEVLPISSVAMVILVYAFVKIHWIKMGAFYCKIYVNKFGPHQNKQTSK